MVAICLRHRPATTVLLTRHTNMTDFVYIYVIKGVAELVCSTLLYSYNNKGTTLGRLSLL